MSFGLTNAPATFQRAMDIILRGLSWVDLVVYLDDIVVFANSLEEHRRRLELLLERLENAGIKIKPEKCKILPQRLELLGHIVTKDGISVDPRKIKVINEWPSPSNLHELRSFLGHAGYHQNFIPNYAELTAPLRRLEQKGTEFKWNDEAQKAFQQIKNVLMSATFLAFPNYDLSFIIDTDASEEGIGAVISQKQDGVERPIAYAAKALRGAQRTTYTVYMKEMLALAWALEHFEPYIYGKKFLVRTDNAALSWLKTTKNVRGHMTRWLERIMEFMPFDIEHRQGKLHTNADGLSRIPWKVVEDTEEEVHLTDYSNVVAARESMSESRGVFEVKQSNTWQNNFTLGPLQGWSLTQIAEAQSKERNISLAISWVNGGQRPPRASMDGADRELWSLWSQFQRLKVLNNVLYRVWFENDHERLQLWLPRSLMKPVLFSLHDCSGHIGGSKTIEKVRARFHWFGLRNDIELYIQQCLVCQRVKNPVRQNKGEMRNIASGYPLERIGIDIVGPLPKTEQGNAYIVVMIDYFTKFPFAYALKEISAETVANVLMDQVICMFGVPMSLHSDQGSNFESNVFQALCSLVNMAKTRTTPYAPWSNGETERMNRTLMTMLKCMVEENPKSWDLLLQKALMHYRSSVHASTQFTPYALMFGREMRLPIDACLPDPPGERLDKSLPKCIEDHKERIRKTESVARENLRAAQKCQKDYYDNTSCGGTYAIGELVWLKSFAIPKGTSRKFFIRWSGPWKIVKVISDVTYRIHLIDKGKRRRVRQVVHFNRLKKCYVDEANEGSQNERDSGNAVLGPHPNNDTVINQEENSQSNPGHENLNPTGENSDSEEEDQIASNIQLPADPARAQQPRMGTSLNDSRERRAHWPPVTQGEIMDDSRHQADISFGRIAEEEGDEMSAQRPHLSQSMHDEDGDSVNAQRLHPTQQSEVSVQRRGQELHDEITGETQRPPGDMVMGDEFHDRLNEENLVPPVDTVARDTLNGEAQRPPEMSTFEEVQDGLDLGAQRPQEVHEAAGPRRSSRQVKRPEYLKDYLTETDDIFDF